MTTTKPQTMTLFVSSLIFDGDTINLPALFELRAADWSVEIWHSGADPDWAIGGMEPQIFFTIRKLCPDSSPGVSADIALVDGVCGEIQAFSEKWDAFHDCIAYFKNPKPMAWKFEPWACDDKWDEKYERS
jgi:hypothetical protein